MTRALPADGRPTPHGWGGRRSWWLPAAAVLTLLVVLTRRITLDLSVYRAAGQTWLSGGSLYAPNFPGVIDGPSLPFTYPPLAAVLFAPLAVVPDVVAMVLITLSSVVGFAVLASAPWWPTDLAPTWRTVRTSVARGEQLLGALWERRRGAALVIVGAVGAAAFSEPVLTTALLGQVNLVLAALVVLDVLLPRTPWPRGTLIGIAAAVKLTPAVFVLALLVRRDWRASVTAVVSGVLVTGAGFALAPADSTKYWFDVVSDPSRIGGLDYAGNQSLRGVLHRFALAPALEDRWWLGAVLATVALGLVAAARAHARGRDPEALLAVATTGLLASPVSWTHHWVWLSFAVCLLGYRCVQDPSRGRAAVLLATAALAVVGPPRLAPSGSHRELAWGLGNQLIGNSYAIWGVAVLGVLAVWPRPQPVG